jgi:hypothetical protein
MNVALALVSSNQTAFTGVYTQQRGALLWLPRETFGVSAR